MPSRYAFGPWPFPPSASAVRETAGARLPYSVSFVIAEVHRAVLDAATSARRDEARIEEELVQAGLIRDILGLLPFRALTLNPAWVTPTVHQLAQAAYDDRTLPI